MKPQEIKIGHIYYVCFSPTKKGEFPDKHLAIVLKKNADKITFIAIPLTSKEKGMGINKIFLGKLSCLPKNLQENESYAVLDQVRTLSAERFYALKEDGKVFEAELPPELLRKIRQEVIKDFLFCISKEEQISILEEIIKSNSDNIDESPST